MYWADKLAEKIQRSDGPQVINDSKTPSGPAHVGALRGVLIHDAIFRALREIGVEVVYRFGVDDYDPLDEIPKGQDEHFVQYLGQPLCNVPALPGSGASDMAEQYISEFFEVFEVLGVAVDRYRMRDYYRSGQFNEPIDAILRQAEVVRKVYKDVSGSDRPSNWYPFQAICESCGRLGTTEVTDYDGKEVTYTCRPDLVKWATGCGHSGKVSPFDGNGKLPWKLEWVAKWKTFPVTIEGAGKDHTTRGGSRDVAAACLREIFGQSPPVNIPYEFFLVGGAKMSSSRGLGVSASAMSSLLPPEVLRFLVLRTQPQRPVNFEPGERSIVKLFNDYDRLQQRYFHDDAMDDGERRTFVMSELKPEGSYFSANFQLLLTLIQMPHIDVLAEVEKRKGDSLTDVERRRLEIRCASARFWLENYCDESERIHLQETLPEIARDLSPTQRAFLHQLAAAFAEIEWNDDAVQGAVFNVARLTPIAQKLAFEALYRAFLGRDSGPKAGNLLSCLDSDFVRGRLVELEYSTADYWKDASVSSADLAAWVDANADKIACAGVRELSSDGLAVFEFRFELEDGKAHGRLVESGPGAREEIDALTDRFGEKFDVET